MQKKAPSKSFRSGLSLPEIARIFEDEDTAREWIESVLWPDGPFCPHCGSFNVQCNISHKTMTHRCRDCHGKPMFTPRRGSVMEGSKLKYQTWAVGIYLYSVNIKGTSSMQLHRELKIGQKAAWFMLHRLRAAFEDDVEQFAGPVEADETYMGGKEGNKHWDKKLNAGRGTVGKTAVAGVKDRGEQTGYCLGRPEHQGCNLAEIRRGKDAERRPSLNGRRPFLPGHGQAARNRKALRGRIRPRNGPYQRHRELLING